MPERVILRGVNVVREGRTEPFLGGHPGGSSCAGQWGGIALENWSVPAVSIPPHEHPEHFLNTGLRGAVKWRSCNQAPLH
jgi:AraC family transcriptional regulator